MLVAKRSTLVQSGRKRVLRTKEQYDIQLCVRPSARVVNENGLAPHSGHGTVGDPFPHADSL
jgi:hypothetical protein